MAQFCSRGRQVKVKLHTDTVMRFVDGEEGPVPCTRLLIVDKAYLEVVTTSFGVNVCGTSNNEATTTLRKLHIVSA